MSRIPHTIYLHANMGSRISWEIAALNLDRQPPVWSLNLKEGDSEQGAIFCTTEQLEQLLAELHTWHNQHIAPALADALLGSDPEAYQEPHSFYLESLHE